MPSAEVKQETMASSETPDPFHKAMTYLKFKIKNMEQRKVSGGKKNLLGLRHNSLGWLVPLLASTCAFETW